MKKKPSLRSGEEIKKHDGFSDHLEPLASLDLGKCKTVDDLVRGMGKTAFGGRSVGEAADVLYEMANDKKCLKVGTFSGAMTVAKMGLVLCDMIDSGMLDIVISTGALMAHGFIEAAGMTHFKYRQGMDDAALYRLGYNRVYDTVEPEVNFDNASGIITRVISGMPQDETFCSYKVCAALGKYLHENDTGRGILKSAYERKIPVYIPAFTDSELGLDFSIYGRRCEREGRKVPAFDPFLDLRDYADRVKESGRLGVFTIGGGVPRNWAQQVAPYIELLSRRLGEKTDGTKKFHYGIRICPEPVHWGGLSGCTYSEGVSWGKFVPASEGGKQVEVFSDATIAWPLIVKAVLERMGKG
ncbi:MAG: deoxyhypusine synthase family protein [Candidatus Micrarchaeota archaeon]|nr:deoxyhypusine synthase family protein [Candidatus Micrarchaeota archaeon]